MTALAAFQTNIASADAYTRMYAELRKTRALGRRGVLPAKHRELLWLPRAAVVASISALDTYVHTVVADRAAVLLRDQAGAPVALYEAVAKKLSVKNGATLREAIPLLAHSDPLGQLFSRFRDDFLVFQSFQAPDKIVDAYEWIGRRDIFERAADLWPGPNTTSQHLKSRLANYVNRRNQIAHEADMGANNTPRAMSPDYALDCRAFITSLVERMDQVVYAA